MKNRKTYISILRGINVSGSKIIKMEDLKRMYENLNLENIQTYLQSGNVIFSSKETDLKKLEIKISHRIEKDFGFKVPVIVMTAEILQNIVEQNPFTKDSKKEPSFLHVTFLDVKSKEFDIKSINDKKQGNEEIKFSDNAVYLYCPDGYGNTKLNNNFLENKLKVQATTRNWKTINELLKLGTEE
jgi:uncharacterized protein (DUF1697 family)